MRGVVAYFATAGQGELTSFFVKGNAVVDAGVQQLVLFVQAPKAGFGGDFYAAGAVYGNDIGVLGKLAGGQLTIEEIYWYVGIAESLFVIVSIGVNLRKH